MSNRFKYRFRSPLGGLAADLAVEHRTPGAEADGGIRLQIHRNVRLGIPDGTHWRDAAWLSFGISVHSADLAAAHPDGLLVEVTSLTFPHAHFRSEVAALAMDGWVREEFALPDRGLRAVFDSAKGAYQFHWGGEGNPFSDEF